MENKEPLFNIPPPRQTEYEVRIEETRFLQRYIAYISMRGVRYSRKDYEKKVVGTTLEEVERRAKEYIDAKRAPDPEPEYVKRFTY